MPKKKKNKKYKNFRIQTNFAWSHHIFEVIIIITWIKLASGLRWVQKGHFTVSFKVIEHYFIKQHQGYICMAKENERSCIFLPIYNV